MRAADLVGTDVVTYFVTGQIPVAICIIIAVAVGHALVQRWFDRREAAKGISDDAGAVSGKTEDAFAGAGPAFYAILPILPLFLLIIFSPMVYNGIKLNLVTAIIVSILVAFVVDLVSRRALKDVCKDFGAFFEGMGKVFTSTVRGSLPHALRHDGHHDDRDDRDGVGQLRLLRLLAPSSGSGRERGLQHDGARHPRAVGGESRPSDEPDLGRHHRRLGHRGPHPDRTHPPYDSGHDFRHDRERRRGADFPVILT